MDWMTTTIFTCDQCTFISKSKPLLYSHIAEKHPPKMVVSKLKCSKCDFESYYSYHMKKHEEKCGFRDTILHCEDKTCDFKISSIVLLARHEQKQHGITTKKLTLKKNRVLLKCQKCGFSTAHKNSLKIHEKKCSLSTSVTSCNYCEFTSYSPIIVNRHSRKNHGFDCQKCDFRTKSKSIFLQHKKSHPVSIECSKTDCGFSGTRDDVKKHQEDIHGIINTPKLTENRCDRCDYMTSNTNR